jgi:hypothetical protein
LKNKFNTIDAVSYTKMRSVLAIDDLSQLCFLNTSVDTNPIGFIHEGDFDYCVNSLEKIFSSEKEHWNEKERSEYYSNIVPLSQSAHTAEAAIGSLSRSEGDMSYINLSDIALYKFSVSNTGIITVILREDFFLAVQNKKVLLDFMRECLRYLYGLVPIAEVSNTSLFTAYMKELKSTTT